MVASSLNDPILTAPLMMSVRVTKLVLLIGGTIASFQKQISFYHCLVISQMAILMTNAETGEYKHISAREAALRRSRLSMISRIVGFARSTMHGMFLISLLSVVILNISNPDGPLRCYNSATPADVQVDSSLTIVSNDEWGITCLCCYIILPV